MPLKWSKGKNKWHPFIGCFFFIAFKIPLKPLCSLIKSSIMSYKSFFMNSLCSPLVLLWDQIVLWKRVNLGVEGINSTFSFHLGRTRRIRFIFNPFNGFSFIFKLLYRALFFLFSASIMFYWWYCFIFLFLWNGG